MQPLGRLLAHQQVQRLHRRRGDGRDGDEGALVLGRQASRQGPVHVLTRIVRRRLLPVGVVVRVVALVLCENNRQRVPLARAIRGKYLSLSAHRAEMGIVEFLVLGTQLFDQKFKTHLCFFF